MNSKDTVTYAQIAEDTFKVGQQEFTHDTMGKVTYVGVSKDGDVVLQQGENITTFPELRFNLEGFRIPVKPQVFFYSMSKHELDQLSLKQEPLIQLADLDNELADYKVKLTVIEAGSEFPDS